MDLRIEILGIIFLTTLTGSIALLMWCTIGKLLEQAGYFKLYYYMLRFVVLLFIIPIAAGILIYTSLKYQMWRGILFSITPMILIIGRGILFFWILGSFITLLRYVIECCRQNHFLHLCFPCELWKNQLLMEVCHEMNINSKKIILLQNHGICSPILMGLFRPIIILPTDQFSEDTLRVVFVHELMHVAGKDILWKRLVVLITITQFFNPMVWVLFRYVQIWTEYACDYNACRFLGGIRNYFSCILQIAERGKKSNARFSTHLIENEHQLLRRVKFVEKNRKRKKRVMTYVVSVCLIMLILFSSTVYASTFQTAQQYVRLFDATVVMIEVEPVEYEPFTVYTDNGPVPGVAVEVGDIDQASSNIYNFYWTIDSNVQKVSGLYYISAGSHINIMMNVVPSDVKVGIIDASGKRTYSISSGFLSGYFTVSSSGYYKIFVENLSASSVTVEATYAIL